MRNVSNRAAAVYLVAWMAATVVGPGVADARPIRGPVARAERRMFRAQMALERELARPLGRAGVIEVPAQAVERAATPAQPTRPPEPRAAAAAAAAPQAESGVARAAFEAPVPRPATADAPRPAAPSEPAADGTVSVLVRPEAQPAAQPKAQEPAAEPLLFPGTSQP